MTIAFHLFEPSLISPDCSFLVTSVECENKASRHSNYSHEFSDDVPKEVALTKSPGNQSRTLSEQFSIGVVSHLLSLN